MSAAKRKDEPVSLTPAQTRKLDQLDAQLQDMRLRHGQAQANADAIKRELGASAKRLEDFMAGVIGDEYKSEHEYRTRVEGDAVLLYRDVNGDG